MTNFVQEFFWNDYFPDQESEVGEEVKTQAEDGAGGDEDDDNDDGVGLDVLTEEMVRA